MSPEKKTKDSSAAKAKKVKLVRDSFCMPKEEYAQIELLKQRLLALGKAVKKSELLRAGVIERPCTGWNFPDHLRVTVGTTEENRYFLQTLAQALRRVQGGSVA